MEEFRGICNSPLWTVAMMGKKTHISGMIPMVVVYWGGFTDKCLERMKEEEIAHWDMGDVERYGRAGAGAVKCKGYKGLAAAG